MKKHKMNKRQLEKALLALDRENNELRTEAEVERMNHHCEVAVLEGELAGARQEATTLADDLRSTERRLSTQTRRLTETQQHLRNARQQRDKAHDEQNTATQMLAHVVEIHGGSIEVPAWLVKLGPPNLHAEIVTGSWGDCASFETERVMPPGMQMGLTFDGETVGVEYVPAPVTKPEIEITMEVNLTPIERAFTDALVALAPYG